MAIEVKRRDNETQEAMVRRFKYAITAARLIDTVKGRKHRQRALSKRTRKVNALVRGARRAKYDYLKKMGLDE